MISKDKTALISGSVVSCMLVVAWSEFQHGKPLGEIHLITPAPLTAGSTVVFTGAGYHHNSVIEAEYRAPPDSRPLPRDGLMHPSA